jgi:hypothetical protein
MWGEKDAASGMKSAYEVALERLEGQGIERPREGALTDEIRREVAEVRSKAEAQLAELEILHRDARKRAADPAARSEAEEEYRIERRRIEDRRDTEIQRLRDGA